MCSVRSTARETVCTRMTVPLTRPASEFQLTRSPILKVLVMTARFNQNKLPHRFGEALVLIAVGHSAACAFTSSLEFPMAMEAASTYNATKRNMIA
jgi:hypothetical protein